MNTKRIDLNLLATLEALLIEQNVTKAAERLHLSQPAVSTQLNRLRTFFNDPLLVPAHRGMTPTVKGLELLGPLRQALVQLRNTVQESAQFLPVEAKFTVNIACSDYIQAAVITPLVLALRQRAPGIRIAIRHLSPTHVQQQLANGEADIAIATPETEQPSLHSRHLYTENYILIGRRHHPRLKGTLSIEQYAKLDHVVVSRRGGAFSTHVDEKLAKLGFRRNVVLSAASFLFVPEIISASDFVALVPRRLLKARDTRLTRVHVPGLAKPFDISLLWHERSHAHAGQQWIRELITLITADAGEEKVRHAAQARRGRSRA